MSDPWFDANSWAWLPGTAIGAVCGLWGAIVGTLASRGKGKGLVWALFALLVATGLAMTVFGFVALASKQPYAIWYPFVLPGVLILLVLVPLGFVTRAAYRNAELRRMQAQEFE